jgi:hypothetical protein
MLLLTVYRNAIAPNYSPPANLLYSQSCFHHRGQNPPLTADLFKSALLRHNTVAECILEAGTHSKRDAPFFLRPHLAPSAACSAQGFRMWHQQPPGRSEQCAANAVAIWHVDGKCWEVSSRWVYHALSTSP